VKHEFSPIPVFTAGAVSVELAQTSCFCLGRQLVDFLMDRHLFFLASPYWVMIPDDTPQ
jgi:hypothetical protein